jgi:type IV pilus assembly protein PilN
MIRINLLPFRAARQKENIRRQLSAFVLSMFFVTGVLFYVSGFWTKKIDSLDTQIKQINSELTRQKAAAKEVDQITQDLAELEKKTEVILNLKKTRREPVEMLDAMTGLVVEERMWFTDFSDENGTVKIKGVALDNKTVSDFMNRLEQSGLFSDVSLDSTKQQTLKNSLSLKSFQFTCKKTIVDNASDDKAASS